MRFPLASRRHALQWLAGAPLLPLTWGGSDPAQAATPDAPVLKAVRFSSMAAPTLANPAAMATTTVGSVMHTEFSDGSQVDHALAYESFFVTGDWVPDGQGGKLLAGGYYDIHNQPILDTTVAGRAPHFFSDCPDGTSLLRVPGARVAGVQGNTVFAVVQFEYTTRAGDGATWMWGKLPSPIAVLTLDQNPRTGKLRLVKYHNVDTAGVHGLWITCGASLSPWGTHLSSEEYEPDAFAARTQPEFRAFSKNLYGSETAANPYHYGHLPEVTVHADGTGSIRKHYCLGRISHELVQVMPDQRTLMMGDDATNGGCFVFVADREKDLSAGTLYVAKIGAGLVMDPAAPAAPLGWIRLGAATSAEIQALADRLQPTDIFSVKNADPQDRRYTRVTVNGAVEWIRLMPGMEKAAAFLETHRYAALVGGSLGFTKLEGTTVNIRDRTAYSALQNIETSMVAGDVLNVPGNGIAVPQAIMAGAVLAFNLRGGLQDTLGRSIRSDWMPADIRPLLVGQDIPADALGNTADPDHVANPDNLKFSEGMRTLFIGEDSSHHINNFLWAYHVDTRVLSRILSVPAAAESTGLHAVDDLNGWTYIMSNFQHPGHWEPIHDGVKDALEPLINARYQAKRGAAVGYLTALPGQFRLGKG